MSAPRPGRADRARRLRQKETACASLRQAVHTANIANASVDGYQRLEVSFDAQLEKATAARVAESEDAATTLPEPTVIHAADPQVRLEQEMALMAKDALHYQTLLGAVDRTVSLLELAIREGKGV